MALMMGRMGVLVLQLLNLVKYAVTEVGALQVIYSSCAARSFGQ